MALYLVELTPAQPSKDEATALIETVNSSLTNGAELIETQVSADHKIVFVTSNPRTPHSAPTSPQQSVSAQPSQAPTQSAWSAQSSKTSRSSRRTQTTWLSGTSPQRLLWNST